MVFDQPWEGNACAASATVLFDGDRYRMYYAGGMTKGNPTLNCYAESKDGIHWVKPELGLFEYGGSKKNNITLGRFTPPAEPWDGYADTIGSYSSPFKDPNPNCKPDERYKAIYHVNEGLGALKSADGIHWSPLTEKNRCIIKGAFDSQNLAFWDPIRGEYRAYMRSWNGNWRDIRTATSKDFLNWTELGNLEYPGSKAPNARQQLYTNQVISYYRAPHILLGFPTRYTERGWSESMRALPELEARKLRSAVSDRFGTALTDGLFMSSRDGRKFRLWSEAFIRPGLRGTDNWAYGDNYQTWGLVETKSANPDAPDEISIYATEGYNLGEANKLRRFTIRQDGFVSMQASFAGGTFTTKPITYQGDRLVLNFSTSAAGIIRVAIQEADGKPIDGFTLDDCNEVFGDTLQGTVTWKHGSDLGKLAGRPIRLHVTLSDADLYAFQFVATGLEGHDDRGP